MTDGSVFRGYRGIEEIRSKMAHLVELYERFRPDVRGLTVSRSDYDLIARWPKAAHANDFAVTENGIFFRGLRVTYDTGKGRYDKRPDPEQEVIE